MIIETDEQDFNEVVFKGVKQALPEWNGTAEEAMRLYEDADAASEFRDSHFWKYVYPQLSEDDCEKLEQEIRILRCVERAEGIDLYDQGDEHVPPEEWYGMNEKETT